MNFNSAEFALFLISTLLTYALIWRRDRTRDLFLLGASYFFYMSWDWRYAGLIAFSTIIDYWAGRRMAVEERPWARRLLLLASLTTNLGLLAVFKYFNFFMDAGEQAATLFGMDISLTRHELLLPVGISFYSFQTLSYTIDLYRKMIDVERDPIKFAVFVAFFPQLVAGPIVRASTFLPQLHKPLTIARERFDSGLALVFRGLFKKIVLADLLAGLGVDAVFASPGSFSSWDLLFALYGYAFQIYNDFSGYSDIAIGVARMMGFDLTINFNRPYLSQNVREFWTRWHISLSSWLRDYLYIPLGGNRAGAWRVRVNLMITMLLGGLWHGAAMNFVLWGAWHGLLLVFARGSVKHDADAPKLLVFWRRFLCFHLVVVSWLLFRIGDMGDLATYVTGMLQFDGGTRLHPFYYGILAIAAAAHFTPKDLLDRAQDRLAASPALIQAWVYAALLLAFVGLSLGAPAFIYFQF